jgi:SpoVK/Ycf46/Vps4 family AAA+-type ATPase
MVVSKYIGGTEKNLSLIFDESRIKNWILFFDEADALFGKRTGNTAANNSTSNLQVDFLLKEIERYDGAVILASTLRANMDEAFAGLFDVMIHFSMPTIEERYQLWRRAFSGQYSLSPEIDLHEIAEKHELSGGAIINILRFCALAAIRKKDTVVTKETLIKGIQREYKKEGKRIG